MGPFPGDFWQLAGGGLGSSGAREGRSQVLQGGARGGPCDARAQRGTACELRSEHRSLRAAEGRRGRGKPRRLQVRKSACPRQRQGQHHPESSESKGAWGVGARRAVVSGAVPPHVQVSDPRRGYGPRAYTSPPAWGSCWEPPGSCTKGKGGTRGLAHVRRVWRAATV